MKSQKGFSLIELLIVVVVIGVIAAIAIPNLLASRRAANEAATISNLRTISSSEETYRTTLGSGTNYATLPTLNANNLVDAVIGSNGSSPKNNYSIVGSIGSPATKYSVVATPSSTSGISATGTRNFGVSGDGVIYTNSATSAISSNLGDLTGTGLQPVKN